MSHITLEALDDGIRVLRLHRPHKRNALTDEMVAELASALRQVAAARDCRVLILTGSGAGFCAGFDLTLVDEAPGQDELGEAAAWMHRQEAFAALVTQLRGLPQPVIAAINGAAAGAGFGLALAADIRIAARAASFSCAFVRVGMSSCDIGVSWLLPRAIGTSRAFEIMLTGRDISAAEAERIGLVSELTEDEDLLARALEVARSITANSSFGVWMTKRGAWAGIESASLSAAIELENRTQILARTTGELQRSAKALLHRARNPSSAR